MATDVTVIKDHIRYTTVLETTSCGPCSIPFAMPQDMLRRARENSDVWFWCPNGHKLHFTEDECDRLKARLTSAQAALDRARADAHYQRSRAEMHKRSAAAYKGQLTRARKRAGAGVCPVRECHRTVRQLADHMATKHPDYNPDAVTEET